MNESTKSSPAKTSRDSSVDDSAREEEHDWDSYLIETNSEAAPASNFKQALIPPVNEFVVGEKLESIDPRNQDSWCIGTIIEKNGPRLRIRLDGTDNRNDFWRLVDSSDIRCYRTTAKLGGQIVPPLGFQQNSTRWAKYFERYVKDGPFAAESCFKPPPAKPAKNFFKKGQKLEAVDPKHPHLICPATVSSVMPGDYRIMLSLDGWSLLNNFKVDYTSRDIFPVGWCKLAGIRIASIGSTLSSRTSNKILVTTLNKQNGNIRDKQSKDKKIVASRSSNDSLYSSTTMDEKNNNLTSDKKINPRANNKNDDQNSINGTKQKTRPIVTVYFNYLGDNNGMLLNPQKFRSSMPVIFGPDECHVILSSIFDSCIRCAFQQASIITRILDIFPTPNDEDKASYTRIKLENGAKIYILQLETQDDFWNTIRTFQNVILSGYDLFIATKPTLVNNSTNDSSSSLLSESKFKRKHTEYMMYPENKTLSSNVKIARSNSDERIIHDKKSSVNESSIETNHPDSNSKLNRNGHRSCYIERFTPREVATFIQNIDPSFDSLASRFFQEEIDGKALLLLTTDTLMRHMGLKLGPSLKIVHHVEQLKKY